MTIGGAYITPPGCPAGTRHSVGFGVGDGTPAALQTQAAWSTSYFLPLSCSAITPALAGGGPAGGPIGMLDQEGPGLTSAGAVGFYFRRFDPSTKSFGAPVLVSDETTESTAGAIGVSLAADASGGMYALWADHRGWLLDYSADGGATWGAPGYVNLPPGAADAVLAARGGGGAEIGYINRREQFVVPVTYSQLDAPPS